MMTTIISALVGLFCTSVSSIVTFILTKRKYDTEVNSQQIDNMNNSFDIYKKMTEETLAMQNKKMEMQDEKIKQLQEENNDLRKELHHLQLQMAQWLSAVCYDTSCKVRMAELPSATASFAHTTDLNDKKK